MYKERQQCRRCSVETNKLVRYQVPIYDFNTQWTGNYAVPVQKDLTNHCQEHKYRISAKEFEIVTKFPHIFSTS